MKYISGNLVTLAKEGKFDIIVHGCNCFNTMNSGIAKEIKENFPIAYEVDQLTKRGDRNKLGTYKEKLRDQKYEDRDKPKVPDSFIKHAYKSWKNKFCLPINFE